MGLYGKDSNHYQDGDLYLAAQVPGIDVIVGGHTHSKVTQPVVENGTLIVQAGGYSEYVGKLDLTVDTDADAVVGVGYKLVSINGKERIRNDSGTYYRYLEPGYVEDRAILEAMKPYMEQADELLSQPVGEALVELVGSKNESRTQETNLGNLITDGMRSKVGADIAFQNGGGIRAGIAPGTITYRDVLTVQPFGNILTTLDMTGAQVMEVLNYAASLDSGAGAFLHVSGVKWTLNRQTKTAEDVMVGDAPIDLEKTYVVVTNNFMAAGGDGYAMLKDLPKYETGFVDADALMEYISAAGKVEPKVDGRLTIIE
jgi:5'-nucleotidase/UDP-sugar diphosphatase